MTDYELEALRAWAEADLAALVAEASVLIAACAENAARTATERARG